MRIPAISLWQPWASAIALGLKTYETRHWQRAYRGIIAIHAAKRKPEAHPAFKSVADLPTGGIVCLARIADIYPTERMWLVSQMQHVMGEASQHAMQYGLATIIAAQPSAQRRMMISPLEESLGDYSKDRFAWRLEDVRQLKFIPWIGHQGIFYVELPDDAITFP